MRGKRKKNPRSKQITRKERLEIERNCSKGRWTFAGEVVVAVVVVFVVVTGDGGGQQFR